MDNKLLYKLLIVNLILIAILLFSKLIFIHKFIQIITRLILIPIIISTFLYYIIRPLNNAFIKKGMKRSFSALLTLVISIFILSGVLNYFSDQISLQIQDITSKFSSILENKRSKAEYIYNLRRYINFDEAYKYVTLISQNFFRQLILSITSILGYILNTFSTIFLVIIIVFYMLKDGNKFKQKVLTLVPNKYKDFLDKTFSESNIILSHYVTGQAKVALSLAIMIFIGYKIIQLPNALLLSAITFILGFIPFIGFFISMIIPIIIAISMGSSILLKLIILFIIVQTLKGRVVVPVIMSHELNIHPLTDIFLVIGAIALGGPIAAFAIVPVYAVLKSVIKGFLMHTSKAE